jgi:hypothetical protein
MHRLKYFEGVPSIEDMERLEDFVTKVEGFTLSKASLEGISFGMLLRLSGMQSWRGPFFPALKTLHILDCDNATLQTLNLFLSPSLETLEVTVGYEWDDASHDTLGSFLATMSIVAPRLACFKHYPLDSMSSELYRPLEPGCCTFKHVRFLHLEHGAVWERRDVQILGKLESLENLSLITIFTPVYKGRAPVSINGAQWNILADRPPDGRPESLGFQQLKILHVVGHLEFLRDFLGHIGSKEVQNLSIKLLTSRRGPATLEEIKRELTAGRTGARLSDEEAISTIKALRMTLTFRNEDEFFCHLIEKATDKWSQLTLIVIDHVQTTDVPREHYMSAVTVKKALALPCLERLEIVEWVIDFDFENMMDEVGSSSKSQLKTFHLPAIFSAYKSTQGISWGTLSKLAKAFPQLVSFRGYLQRRISGVPGYATNSITATKPPPNFNAKTLILGDGAISWDDDGDPHYLLRVGLYIFSLFPNLEEIQAADETDDKSGAIPNWEQIKRLVRMC